MNGKSVLFPADPFVFPCEKLTVGRFFVILGDTGRFALFQQVEAFGNHAATQKPHPFPKGIESLVFTDGQRFHFQDIPFVHAFAHIHDGNSRFLLTVIQNGVHRRCTAIGRQKRAVNIEDAVRKQFQQFFFQNAAESGNDDHIGVQRFHFFQKSRVIYILRRIDRKIQFQPTFFQRGGLKLFFSALHFIHTADHRDDFMMAFRKGVQTVYGKLGASHINYSHFFSFFALSMNKIPSR